MRFELTIASIVLILGIIFTWATKLKADDVNGKSFHCFTRVTYTHYVYSSLCPRNTDEVMLGRHPATPAWILCGKLEAECLPPNQADIEKPADSR